ncbi:Ubiquinol-cytochrome C chaperone [Necator americanus]|uniref:Ubiquinol-cytochrome C chaperone n=1 Tax=Necator americanus TaxID=51031 RepID=W2SPV2_NECAM|nr:Ubiquinol-cytochrome C chaperone [Necator americanus]ETN70722.1 Ubiquinol-cytochrome C chaperone [Necator americanus]
MLTRSVFRRLIHVRSMASTSGESTGSHKVSSVDDLAQNLLSAPPSRLPKGILRLLASWKARKSRDTLDPGLKSEWNCETFAISAFGLPDYMSSWYKLTLMHCWMVLMRMHVSLDAQAYLRLQRSMLSTMWFDVDNRLKIVGQELGQTLTSESDLKSMHGLHLQTFLEYDEGFLTDDRVLAGAVWRCLYVSRSCDPIHVLRTIAYMRATIAWLDTLDLKEIMVDGIKEWKQMKPKDVLHQEKNDAPSEVTADESKEAASRAT